MNRSFIIGLLAVAAMTAVSCNKEIDKIDAVPSNGTHKVVFKADQVATKTSLTLESNEYVALWTDADESNFHIFENGEEGLADMTISADSKSATFTAVFNDGAPAPFTYTAILAHSYDDNTKLALVESIQTPAANNIDGDADMLVAKPVVLNTKPTTDQHFQFKRVVSVNKMTLRGLEVGEKVTEVTISGDKQIAAAYNFSTDEFDYTEGEDEIILGYTTDNVISSAGTFDVFFVCAPVEDVTLSIEVKTADSTDPSKTRTYKKDFTKTISFDAVSVAEFVANITCCEEVTGSTAPTVIFYETFDSCDSTGGNDNNFGTASNNAMDSNPDNYTDNAGWTFVKGYPADHCAKMGGSSALGSATTPALGITASTATLTFRAAAFNNSAENTTLKLSVIGNGELSETSVTLKIAEWDDSYSVTITDGDADTKIKFEGGAASKGRFYLDDVKVEEEKTADPNTVSLSVADNTDITATTTAAIVDVSSNKAWTVTSSDSNLADTPISIKKTAQDGSFTVNFADVNTSVTTDKVATLHIVAGAGTYAVSKDITITQKAATPVLKLDGYANTTKEVAASAISATFTVTQCNFDWDIISITVGGVAKTASDGYSAVKGSEGLVTVSFPSNEVTGTESTTNRSIVVTVGDSAIKTATCTITQAGETYVDPNKKYFVEVTSEPSDWSGIYLLVSGSKAYNAAAATGASNTGINVTVAGDRIEADNSNKLNSVVISAGSASDKWYIKGKTGYIGDSGSSGGFAVSATGIDNTIEYNEGLVITSGGLYLRYNSDHFRYYTGSSTGSAVKLYRFTGTASDLLIGQLELGTISVTEGDETLTFSWDAPEGATSATKYNVYWNGSGTPEVRSDDTARTFTKTGLSNDTPYYIEVVAVGDGTFYSNSDKKKSANGTPHANQNTGKTYSYTFTSKAWVSTEEVSEGTAPGITWSGSQDGNQLTSGQGVQITNGLSGVTVTSSAAFTGVSKIVVTYCTNASQGAGAIKVKVGTGTEKSFTVTKPSSGGTTLKTCQFDYSSTETGAITLTVDCTTSSIYINKIEITAE